MSDHDEPEAPQGGKPPDEQRIPVVEEQVSIERVTEKTGDAVRVRIASHEELQRVPVVDTVEELAVERIPVGHVVTERSAPWQEGDTLVIPVYETVAVVEQRLVLKEELRIVRRRRELPREHEVVLRKETAVIERREAGDGNWRPEAAED